MCMATVKQGIMTYSSSDPQHNCVHPHAWKCAARTTAAATCKLHGPPSLRILAHPIEAIIIQAAFDIVHSVNVYAISIDKFHIFHAELCPRGVSFIAL